MFKKAEASTAASPIPQVEISSQLAPGKRGPAGTAPRTNYSRVNTGVPPTPDAGGQAQKSMAPGAPILPKMASEDHMGMAVRPTVQDMVKAAMEGAAAKVDLSREMARQAENLGVEKVASAETPAAPEATSIEFAHKLAAAVEYIAQEISKEAENKVEPGKGPGALQVLEAQASTPLPDHKGQAHQTVPMTPGTEKVHKPEHGGTAMATNDGSPAGFHGKQQASMVNQKAGDKIAEAKKCEKCGKDMEKCSCMSKGASIAEQIRKVAASKIAKEDEKLEAKETEGMSEAAKGLAKAEAAHEKEDKGEKKEEKEAAATTTVVTVPESKTAHPLAGALRQHIAKMAEDAINPAQISAGKAVAPDTRESGQAGGVAPAGGQTAMVASSEAATNYTKGKAKAEPKSDLKAYVKEPALSGSTDSVLRDAFAHTGQAGTKFASAPAEKTAAARALLQKIAEAAKAQTTTPAEKQ